MSETESLPLLDKVELLKQRLQTVTGGDERNHNNLSFIEQIESDEADKKRGISRWQQSKRQRCS